MLRLSYRTMFRPLGLLTEIACPDKDCKRVQCFFKHGATSAVAAAAVAGHSAVKRKTPAAASPEKRAKVDGGASSAKATASVPVQAAMTPASAIGRRAAAAKPQVRTQDGAAHKQAPQAAVNAAKPPMIQAGRTSKFPLPDRQKALQTLFTQFTKLYAKLLPSHPALAHEAAAAQEDETYASVSNLRAYKTAIHHAAVQISRRPTPDTLSHPSVGTAKQSRVATDAAAKEAAGRLTRARVLPYCLEPGDFAKWAYPDPGDAALAAPPAPQPDASGTEQTCARCRVPFVVDARDLAGRVGECRFHHGRAAPERVDGKRVWILSCCKRERGSAGCEEGVHVYSDRDDDAKLAQRVAFKTSAQVADDLGRKGLPSGSADVVGMDCEMIYTTAGSSLARVTVVDAQGKVLVDEIVRQTVPVLVELSRSDVNSRFSGIQPSDLDKAVLDLAATREAVGGFIGPDTVIVGHGLENDLRALRLLHSTVVDTAVVFPHEKGHPFRRALRDIVKEQLGVFIQDRTADYGHSSAEDARATLDVLRCKVREDGAAAM